MGELKHYPSGRAITHTNVELWITYALPHDATNLVEWEEFDCCQYDRPDGSVEYAKLRDTMQPEVHRE